MIRGLAGIILSKIMGIKDGIRRLYRDHGHPPPVYKNAKLAPGGPLDPDNIVVADFVIHQHGDDVIAMAHVDPQTGEMDYLTVHPDHRRRGLGRQVVAMCHNKAGDKLNFSTIDHNNEAIHFYESLGFVAEVGRMCHMSSRDGVAYVLVRYKAVS